MLPLLFTGISGWVLVVLLGGTTALPYALRRGVFAEWQTSRPPHPYLQRMRPHYVLGYAVAGVVLAHAWLSMGAGSAKREATIGLYFATGALVLIVVQVCVGLRLRERGRLDRKQLRRVHFVTMAAVLSTAAAHIALNSSVGTLAREFIP